MPYYLENTVAVFLFPGANEGAGLDVWNVTFGGKVQFGVLFVGGETGYLSEVGDWGWVPSLGARFDRLEIAARLATAGADGWTTLRAGWYF